MNSPDADQTTAALVCRSKISNKALLPDKFSATLQICRRARRLVCKGYSCLAFSSILVVSIFSVQAKNKCDISGVWDHSAKPAKLLVNLNEAEVTVYSHDNNPKAVGLAVLEALKPTSNSLLWNAQMYSAAEDSFVDVQIALKSCNQLTVSFDGEEVLELVR